MRRSGLRLPPCDTLREAGWVFGPDSLRREEPQGPLDWINLLFRRTSQTLHGIQELDNGETETRLAKNAICGHKN